MVKRCDVRVKDLILLHLLRNIKQENKQFVIIIIIIIIIIMCVYVGSYCWFPFFQKKTSSSRSTENQQQHLHFFGATCLHIPNKIDRHSQSAVFENLTKLRIMNIIRFRIRSFMRFKLLKGFKSNEIQIKTFIIRSFIRCGTSKNFRGRSF